MKPLWVAYPDYHPFETGWRMGEGEDYRYKFWEWWDTAEESKTLENRLAYINAHPVPPRWTHVALSMIWPDKIPGDEFEFFFEDKTLPLRKMLFDHGQTEGLPSMDAWIKDLNESID